MSRISREILRTVKRYSRETVYKSACAAITLWHLIYGFAYSVILPPFQVPDEFVHWATANTRIESFLGAEHPGCNVENNIHAHLKSTEIPFHSDRKITVGLYESIQKTPESCSPNNIGYGNLLTYPGVLAARTISGIKSNNGIDALLVFFLSRSLQGSLLVLALYYVLVRNGLFDRKSKLPAGMLSIAALTTSPLFVQQSFGVTSDLVVNLSLLLTAAAVIKPQSCGKIGLFFIFACGIIAAITKPVIAPLFLIAPIVLIKWPKKLPGLEFENRAFAAVGITLTLIAISAVFTNSSILQVNGTIDPRENLRSLISNPGFALRILNQSINERMLGIRGLISPMGWLDLNLSKSTQNYWLAMCAAGVGIDLIRSFYRPPEFPNLNALLRALFAKANLFKLLGASVMIWGSAIGTSLAMYLCCTPINYGAVYAVQNRYFFPHWIAIFGLVFGLINATLSKAKDKSTLAASRQHVTDEYKGIVAAPVVGVFLLSFSVFGIQVLIEVLRRYY